MYTCYFTRKHYPNCQSVLTIYRCMLRGEAVNTIVFGCNCGSNVFYICKVLLEMSWSKGRETFTSRRSEIELKSIRGKIIANADFRWRKLWPHQSKTDKIAEISIYKKNVFLLTPPLEAMISMSRLMLCYRWDKQSTCISVNKTVSACDLLGFG